MGPLDDAATKFSRWYGPWAALDPGGVAACWPGSTGPGGSSVTGRSGRFTFVARDHEDVGVSLLACDIPALRGHLGNAWTPWSNSAGVLRPLKDRFPDPLNVEGQIWLRRDTTSPWELDLRSLRSETGSAPTGAGPE